MSAACRGAGALASTHQTGGFFAEHRDTEKCDGMVATLSVTLPASGAGELVVRHLEEEARIDMNATEPSELAFAAFYADCAHETRPVREGYRLSLVFNLVVRPDDTETPREAPDYSRQVKEVARELVEWRDSGFGPDKLVWVLEHNYSDAGLSFDALKNADAAVAGVLASAAQEAECALHAAILHVEESGSVRYLGGGYFDEWGRDGDATDDVEMDEVFDGRYWLDGWVAADGTRSGLGEMSLRLRHGETLPAGALDDAVPDREWLNEASGNEGATLERAYRLAALVIWPERATVDLLAGEAIDGAVAWVEGRIGDDNGLGHALISRLIDAWPTPAERWSKSDRDSLGRCGMLGLLARHGDAALCLRFLREVLVGRYDGGENAMLMETLAVTGPAGSREFLLELVNTRLCVRPDALLELMRRVEELPGSGWRDTLRGGVEAALATLPDPVERVGRFPLRADLRGHLHQQIDSHRLDMDHETERRGRPYTLVCTKNHASHERRLKEYGQDVKWMRALAEGDPADGSAAAGHLTRLREALAAAEG